MTIEAIILWIGATVSLTLQYVSWENCHSSLQWVGWLNSETLRIIIEQSDWVTVRRHCNTFWHFMINFQVFGKSCLDALLIRNKIKIAVILCSIICLLLGWRTLCSKISQEALNFRSIHKISYLVLKSVTWKITDLKKKLVKTIKYLKRKRNKKKGFVLMHFTLPLLKHFVTQMRTVGRDVCSSSPYFEHPQSCTQLSHNLLHTLPPPKSKRNVLRARFVHRSGQ